MARMRGSSELDEPPLPSVHSVYNTNRIYPIHVGMYITHMHRCVGM